MERGTRSRQDGSRAIDALMADIELRRAEFGATRPCHPTSQRTIRRSYFYDAPEISPRRIRRQAEIAMIAMIAISALLGGWGLIALLHWLAAMLGSGLTTRLVSGTLRSVLMTLPMA